MAIDMKKSLPGPDNIFRKQLANGVTILIRENPYSQTAAVVGSIPCGAYLDPLDKIGLTEFAAGCLTAGTKTHDFRQINELLECSGASLSVHTGPRAFTFSGSCLAEDLTMLLGLLKEVMDEPLFPAEHIEIFRQQALSAYELHLHDPESMTAERMDALLFGDNPYGRKEFGSEEVIRNMNRQDLCGFHERHFGPQGLILSVVGGVRTQEVLDVCEKIFGTWDKVREPVDTAAYFPKVVGPVKAVSEHTEIPDKSEMSLVIGSLGPARTDPDFTNAILGNSILGEFGMMGRIGRIVREENGLAYDVSSSLNSLTYSGCWTVDAGVNPGNVEKAADLICAELRRFTSEKVTEEELEDVKSWYLGSLPLSLESNAGVASLLISMESYHRGLDYLIRLPERVGAITPESILETARRWIDPDKMIRVTAGTSVK